MKKSRFSEEQIIGILKEQEAGGVLGELARRHGISEGTIYRWKAKYGGIKTGEAQRLRSLEGGGNRRLKRLVAERGRPARIVLDNGPAFTGLQFDRWTYEHEVELAFIRPGKPVQNAVVESFNGNAQRMHGSLNLTDAREIIENWRIDYNLNRSRSSLGGMTPAKFAASLSPRGERNQPKTTPATSDLLTL